MAITYDTSSAGESFATPLTFSHTAGASADFLVVTARTRTGEDITGITYDGDSLTKAVDITHATEGLNSEIWYLASPTTGSAADVVVTASADANIIAQAHTFENIDQSSPLDTSNSTQGNSASLSLGVTPTASSVVLIDCWIHEDRDNASGAGTGQTILYNVDEGQFAQGTSYEMWDNTSATQTWTMVRSDNYSYVLAAFKEAGGTPATRRVFNIS